MAAIDGHRVFRSLANILDFVMEKTVRADLQKKSPPIEKVAWPHQIDSVASGEKSSMVSNVRVVAAHSRRKSPPIKRGGFSVAIATEKTGCWINNQNADGPLLFQPMTEIQKATIRSSTNDYTNKDFISGK